MKKIYPYIIGALAMISITAFAAPTAQNFTNIQPFITNTYNNGASSLYWLNTYTKNLFLGTTTAGCLQVGAGNSVFSTGTDCGSGSSTSFAWPFTAFPNYVATSTAVGFLNGFFSTASSTISAPFRLSTLSDGNLVVYGGLVQSNASTTFSSPLVYTNSTGAVTCPTCNTSSASVTSVGLSLPSFFTVTNSPVTTSGTLTGSIIAPANSILTTNSTGNNIIATGTQLTVGNLLATTTAVSSFGGAVGIGTLTPTDVNANSRLTVAGISSQDIIASTTDNTTLSDAIIQAYAPGARVFMGAHGTNQISSRYGLTLGGWAEISAFNSTFGTVNGLVIGTNTAKPLVFGTNNAEVGRFDSSGNFGIGTTTPGSLFSIGGNATGWNFFNNATTTSSAKGINLINGGCFAINGVCVSGSGGSGSGTVSSGLGGQLGYYNTTGTTIVGTSTNPLYVDAIVATSTSISSYFLGNVGIGTTSPSALLAVNAPGAITAFAVGSSTATNFIIDKMGNVGINTTIPSQLLDVTGGNLTVSNTTANNTSIFSNRTSTSKTASFSLQSLGALVWSLGLPSTTNNDFNISTAGTLASSDLFIQRSSGNIGISTTSPSSKLDVLGNSSFYGTSFFGQTLTATSSVYLATVGGSVGIGTTTPPSLLSISPTIAQLSSAVNPLLLFGTSTLVSPSALGTYVGINSPTGFLGDYLNFQNAGSIAFQVTSTLNGHMILGTSTFATVQGKMVIASTSTAQITLQGNVGEPPVNIRSIGGSLYFSTSSPTSQATTTLPTLGFGNNGQIIVGNYANCNGTTNALGVTSNIILCDSLVSDQRLKKYITTLTDGLSTVLSLRPVTFYWKDLTNHNTSDPREQYGFIAQDVQKILPSAVGQSPDGYLTLDKTALISPIVKAIQELSASFQSLIARVSGLEDRMETQQKEIDNLQEQINNLKK